MEAELQALRQQNEELRGAVREQQEQVATERLHGDRCSRAQMQEFANLTTKLLAGRQGPEVHFDGMRLSVKVEKPENYDGDKAKDLDTWLFKCANIWSYRLSQLEDTSHMSCPCYVAMHLCGGGRPVKRIVDP